MILNKDAFEAALQEDRQALAVKQTDISQPGKKDLFGPQTDLMGMPLSAAPTGQNQEKKEKTRRELMWE